MDEIFPIVDSEGNTIGSAPRATCHDGKSKLLHPVVHLHLISPDAKRVLLQKRSLSKDIQPGKWDTAVGGHVDYGEKISDALLRESREELGIDASGARLVDRYVWESDREKELVHIHLLQAHESALRISADPSEIDSVRFWSLPELDEVRGKGILTPNFEREFFDRVLPYLSSL